MYLLLTKLFFAATILLLALVTGLIPLKIAKHSVNLLRLCNAFASGVFLSTSLLHMLPDAASKFSDVYGNNYPLAYLICIITFLLLLIMERGITVYGKIHFTENKTIAPILLVLLLTIHSLIEGAAIGSNNNVLETITIFFAVLAHKGSESFALATSLYHFKLSIKNIKKIVWFFSLMTPIGIFIASFLIYLSTSSSNGFLEALFSSIAAGTFLYLGTEHLIEDNRSFEKFSELLALIFGVALMALVAVWI